MLKLFLDLDLINLLSHIVGKELAASLSLSLYLSRNFKRELSKDSRSEQSRKHVQLLKFCTFIYCYALASDVRKGESNDLGSD